MNVSGNERLNAPRLRDKYEKLALTRDGDGLHVLRFHTAGGPDRRSPAPDAA
jgi:hypothetical protein